MKKDVKKLREHLGEHYQLYNDKIIKFSRILKYPSRISILINDGTASSAELFLLRAEQSKKVTLYGQNTSGAVDYGETVFTILPCKFYSLYYPASKSLHSIKRPLDNIGIAPNVSIPESDTDWIDFVMKYQFK
jgi:C-terminal processing protease CtpA/Prc